MRATRPASRLSEYTANCLRLPHRLRARTDLQMNRQNPGPAFRMHGLEAHRAGKPPETEQPDGRQGS